MQHCSTFPNLNVSACSFSGGTKEHPGLLKYSVDMRANVRLLKPARVLLPPPCQSEGAPSSSDKGNAGTSKGSSGAAGSTERASISKQRQGSKETCLPEEQGELMHAVLGGRPLLTIGFDNMEVSGA